MCPRILVVARNPGVVHNVLNWLASEGIEPELITDFAAAKPALARRPPDLLITDVRLGDFNGLHLAMHARWNTPATPTLVMGEPSESLKADAARHHASYLAHPVTRETFTAATRRMLQG